MVFNNYSHTFQAGREDRGKFGAKEKRSNPHASTTNKEKLKNKNFMMMRQKMKGKAKRSYQDKQVMKLY